MNITQLIHNRFSPRAFSEKPIEEEQMKILFEAAHWAPSARNEQPWNYKYVFKSETDKYNQMLELLSNWNQKWAQSAPVLIAAICRLTYSYNNTPNEYAWYDLGQSVAYFTIQASDMGLHLHQMGGFDRAKANQLFNLPDNYQVAVIIALGYKGTIDRIPENYHAEELTKRGRLSVSEIASKI